MPRAKKIEGNLDAIAERRAELEAELARVTEAERRAREAERDAGRDVLLDALGKVKIARMDRSEATAIAKEIEKHGAKRIAEKLDTLRRDRRCAGCEQTEETPKGDRDYNRRDA